MDVRKKVCLTTLLALLHAEANAQEPLGRCQVVVSDNPRPQAEIVHSPDAETIARLDYVRQEVESDSVQVTVTVYKFHRNRTRYSQERQFSLAEKYRPALALLDDKGRLVIAGERSATPSTDKIVIYRSDGTRQSEVQGSEVFNANELAQSTAAYQKSDRCDPPDPWICWSSTPYFNRGRLIVFDTLGGVVSINMTDNTRRRDTHVGNSCRMFSGQ